MEVMRFTPCLHTPACLASRLQLRFRRPRYTMLPRRAENTTNSDAISYVLEFLFILSSQSCARGNPAFSSQNTGQPNEVMTHFVVGLAFLISSFESCASNPIYHSLDRYLHIFSAGVKVPRAHGVAQRLLHCANCSCEERNSCWGKAVA